MLKFEGVEYRSNTLLTYEEVVDTEAQLGIGSVGTPSPRSASRPPHRRRWLEALQSLARSRMGIGVLWHLDEGGRPDLMQVRSSAVSSPLGGEPLGAEFVSLDRFTSINMPPAASYPYRPPD